MKFMKAADLRKSLSREERTIVEIDKLIAGKRLEGDDLGAAKFLRRNFLTEHTLSPAQMVVAGQIIRRARV